MERGIIRNREWATQIRDFSGMCFGSITPTDLDGMIEYKNKCFIFYESKHKGANMKFGQQLAFERMINDHGKPSILFVSEHDTNGDIDFANTMIIKYYFQGEWHIPKKQITLRKATENFIEKYGKPNNSASR